ncbi:MAG: hypothetical protein WCF33_11770 [Pseudonocardiaceae bacterium]
MATGKALKPQFGSERRLQNKDNELFVVDLVDDAVVAGADSPLASPANQPGRRRRSWLGGE